MRLFLAFALLVPGAAWAQLGPLPFTAAGQNVGTSLTAPPSGTPRSLAVRAADLFNVLDYCPNSTCGANTSVAIGAALGLGVTDTLAHLAAYMPVTGSRPYSWATNPAFGLTFQMTPSVASATPTQTFTEILTSSFPSYSATVALWQDPAHGNYALLPGMLVSGLCLPAGTTIQTTGTPIGRDPTIAASGTGTTAVAGYGQIILSQQPTASCASNAALTFTIAPAQLQARTVDWLAWQAAMAQAWLSSQGGHVHGPAGKYIVNGEIINAGGITDGNGPQYVLHVSGDGKKQTQIIVPSDLGQDFAVFQEATRGATGTGTRYLSFADYHDFKITGAGFNRVLGQFPNGTSTNGGMDGITVGSNGYIHNIEVSNTRAAFNVLDDHGIIEDVSASNNGYGLYFAPYATVYGGWPCTICGLSGNTVASVAVAATNQVDGAHFKDMNTGFNPYSFWFEPQTANETSANGGGISNSVFDHVFVESAGCFICSPAHNGQVNNNIFIGGVSVDPRSC